MRTWIAAYVAVLVGCSGGPGPGTGGGAGGGLFGTGGGFGTAGGFGGGSTGGGNASGGGSGGAMGGGSGGGGGAMGGGGGAMGGGGGGAEPGGVDTFLRPGFDNQRLAAGPDGRMHLAFTDGAAQSVHYGSCLTNCGDEASWNVVQLRTASQQGVSTTSPYGLGIDDTGRVHLIISGVPPIASTANAIVYATCTANCGTVASWSFLDLSSLAPNRSPIGNSSSFVMTASGALGLFNQGQYQSYDASFLWCPGNCGQLTSWSAGNVINGDVEHVAIDGAGTVHAMVLQGSSSGNDNLLFYGRCASNCTVSTSWQLSQVGFIMNTATFKTGFAVTPSGRVYMAYNQGVTSGALAQDRKLLINSCQGTGCMNLDTWSSYAVGDLDEGENGVAIAPAGEALVMASTLSFDLKLRVCESNCAAGAGSWSAPELIDTTAAIEQVIPPDTGSSCPGTSQSATWWPQTPVVGVSTEGVVVVHNPYAIVKCPQNVNPSRLPPIGRLISSF